MSTRTYRQHCGLAHAMDLLGERWTLLVLRELMLGPKRYRDLLARLPGIGTNLLAARLKTLAGAGLVVREDDSLYALAPAGEELRPALETLALWGYRLLPATPAPGTARVAWAALTMRAMVRAGGPGVTGVAAFHVGDERFWLRLAGADADVRDGRAPVPADVTARTDAGTFFALAEGRLDPEAAVADGDLVVDGDAALLARVLTVFRLPARA